MPYGAKTVADFIKDVESDPSLAELDATNNASVRMRPNDFLQGIAGPLKSHTSIKKLVLRECELGDAEMDILADILAENHTIEELDLQNNKINPAGAVVLADKGLANNKALKTLNMSGQPAKYGGDTLDHFISVYNTNVTLTKIIWRLDDRKAWTLSKLMIRNVEIGKRLAAGKSYTELLPAHLREAPPDLSAPPAVRPRIAPPKRQPTVQDMEEHASEIAKEVGEDPTPPPIVEESAAAVAAEGAEGDPRAKLDEDGKKWTVANHSGGDPIKITSAEMHQSIQIFKCDNATIIIEGKVKCVAIDNCTKTQVIMTDVISSVEVGNSKSIKFQIQGSCPSASIDKTDSCMIYMMSEEAKKMQISTSKHSDVQVTYIKDEEGVEKPIPEQFVHTIDGDVVKSSVSSLYSGDAGLPTAQAGAVVADDAVKEEEPEAPSGEPDARAKLMEDGKRWIIENIDGGEPLNLSHHAKNHTLLIHKCNNATIILDRKINSVAIDGCTKTQVVMTDVISAVEVTNGKSIKFQVSGSCPSASVDKTDSCMVYLMSEAAKKLQLSTSKHSDVQVTYMKGEDAIEKPIPEQFVHTVQPDGSVKSDVSSLYSS